jgi:integrase/recombinase XerD
MLAATKNPRDAAIIALLFDSGMRVGELLSLKVKDVDFKDTLSHVTVDGKTGMRRIPIMFSASYIGKYLDTVDVKPNDPLWKPAGTWSKKDIRLDEDVIRRILQRAGLRAGINKRIYPHLFRHSRATYYANRMTEQQLKIFFGWTGSSQMAATYVHLSGRDIDNAILQANGIKPKEAPVESKLKPRTCPRCEYDKNIVSALHCSRCGSPLDIGTAMMNEKMTEELEESAAKSMTPENEGLDSKIARRYRERSKKRQE